MVNFYKNVNDFKSGHLFLTDTLNSYFSYLPDGLGRVRKKTYSAFKVGTELPPEGFLTEKEVFYLNDFFDLLYEKENTIQKQGLNPPEYFERENYYTMWDKALIFQW